MRFYFIFMICFLIMACAERGSVDSVAQRTDGSASEKAVFVIDPLRVRAAEIASSMDEQLLAAQLLISGIDGRERLFPHTIELFTEIPAGGVMFFRYNLNTDNDAIRNFLEQTTSLITEKSAIPPFIAVDHEGGTVNRFQRGVATLPSASYYWELFLKEGREAALERIAADSLRAGRVINELGFNMNFAPVAEHLIDENRYFLVHRSYGPDPVFAAQAATSFLHGMEQAGILCVVKHFPGSAGLDPHYFLSVLYMDRAELDALALPFSIVINNGARAIMVAHTAVPAIDNEIASLSSAVMKDWLRGDLGFDGIIISDDFIMAAAGGMSPELAAVHSIIAGSDMILVWPADLRRTHSAIISSLENGQLSRDRLLDAAQRVIYEKLRMGLFE